MEQSAARPRPLVFASKSRKHHPALQSDNALTRQHESVRDWFALGLPVHRCGRWFVNHWRRFSNLHGVDQPKKERRRQRKLRILAGRIYQRPEHQWREGYGWCRRLRCDHRLDGSTVPHDAVGQNRYRCARSGYGAGKKGVQAIEHDPEKW